MQININKWQETIRSRYESYLRASFYFKDPCLRRSFEYALKEYELMKPNPIEEPAANFETGENARRMAEEEFGRKSSDLLPALLDRPLYKHQSQSLRQINSGRNAVVATGTASGKTECFLYPILFELYRQHLNGELIKPGTRALILYPMNALAFDQRRRLGEICNELKKANSGFSPTFGQYIGATPEHEGDTHRHAITRNEDRRPGELVFRQEMRDNPPHILLTNYSMLEYLLIRPKDSALFDGERGNFWQFLILDEAHQYRGVRGMEMGMLIRRLKQRLKDGGSESGFRCIATSATISSKKNPEERKKVAGFAKELFDEPFDASDIIFGEKEKNDDKPPQRFHLFLRALEGAFLVHEKGKDKVALERAVEKESESDQCEKRPIEIALCGECGQHYYVGVERNGRLEEAVRDPSDDRFQVEFYMPTNPNLDDSMLLCRKCGKIAENGKLPRDCSGGIFVKKCENHKSHPDQIEECAACGYKRGAIGDPVQEIVHGSDAPNSVIATALHELQMCADFSQGTKVRKSKTLAFADSRQEAAFFAWYAEDTYEQLRDRNLLWRAFSIGESDEGLSVPDLETRLVKIMKANNMFSSSDTKETQKREALKLIYREAFTEQRRLSLSGVVLAEWYVRLPDNWELPEEMLKAPWNLTSDEARAVVGFLLNDLREHGAVEILQYANSPPWEDVSIRPQMSVSKSPVRKRKKVFCWSGERRVSFDYMKRLLSICCRDNLPADSTQKIKTLLNVVWDSLRKCENVLVRAGADGMFQLNPAWLGLRKGREESSIYECSTCAQVAFSSVRGICFRNKCGGKMKEMLPQEAGKIKDNHYRRLYQNAQMPLDFNAEEHTAQLQAEEAQKKQRKFSEGKINLLSSSTTFEVGVDLGDLDVVFLRGVPPEPFNYTQRAGRCGRRNAQGVVIVYCNRRSHDLYHYQNPQETIMGGGMRAPVLRWKNDKVAMRHILATVFSEFFKKNEERFRNVGALISDWQKPSAATDLFVFCQKNRECLLEILNSIVPQPLHQKCGLEGDSWVESIAGKESRLAYCEEEVYEDYHKMKSAEKMATESDPPKYKLADIARLRAKTIAEEETLTFLSRKAVIPKYGFPVDVVELDTRLSYGKDASSVQLQRDLSQAIAEYAPGARVVANKLEWRSWGVKKHPERLLEKNAYSIDRQQSNFYKGQGEHSYIVPRFGFVAPRDSAKTKLQGRGRRLYTTRPYFIVPEGNNRLKARVLFGVQVTEASPGNMIVLCEGKRRKGFYVCLRCGYGSPQISNGHKTLENEECLGALQKVSLAHEFVTDVVRLQFPNAQNIWGVYSLAYALLLGAAQTLDVPDNDLNVTVTGGMREGEYAVVLYDNVPGGAGLVAEITNAKAFNEMLIVAAKRMEGGCGCDISCYGCLRSYRNQFAHPHLDRKKALRFLQAASRKF